MKEEISFFDVTKEAIGSQIIRFADSFGLDKWDYFAIFLAIVSIVIAIKTFKSQKKTETNTNYLVPSHLAQERFIQDLIGQSIGVLAMLYATKKVLKKYEYKRTISKAILNNYSLASDSFVPHELFYSKETSFVYYSRLLRGLEAYRYVIDSFLIEQNKTDITKDQIDYYLNNSIALTNNTIDFCKDLMADISDKHNKKIYKESEISDIIKSVIEYWLGDLTNGLEDKDEKLYGGEFEIFLKYFGDPETDVNLKNEINTYRYKFCQVIDKSFELVELMSFQK